MPALLLSLVLGAGPRPASEALLRQAVARHALAQLRQFDPAWEPSQRDCAGLVRFAYRAAFKDLDPARLRRPLWLDARGRPTDFADARSLLAGSFTLLGRGDAARARLRSGDLVAFRQGELGEEVFHLMLVVSSGDPAHGALVIYHPGAKGAALRGGALDSLQTSAPFEWRPLASNPSFLGFYRFKDWAHGSHQSQDGRRAGRDRAGRGPADLAAPR